ncbi:MAG TPA: amidase, partial [Candidatus Dormibacteraeota bacterium]|nr:amidase [Candidatus Dormibacteraeota bacterium]
MADDSYAWLSATETARQVAAKSLDPQAVVQSHLLSIGLHDPSIHAFVYVDRAAAAAPGQLSGVTLAVKDNLPVAGMPWTDGSAVWR